MTNTDALADDPRRILRTKAATPAAVDALAAPAPVIAPPPVTAPPVDALAATPPASVPPTPVYAPPAPAPRTDIFEQGLDYRLTPPAVKKARAIDALAGGLGKEITPAPVTPVETKPTAEDNTIDGVRVRDDVPPKREAVIVTPQPPEGTPIEYDQPDEEPAFQITGLPGTWTRSRMNAVGYASRGTTMDSYLQYAHGMNDTSLDGVYVTPEEAARDPVKAMQRNESMQRLDVRVWMDTTGRFEEFQNGTAAEKTAILQAYADHLYPPRPTLTARGFGAVDTAPEAEALVLRLKGEGSNPYYDQVPSEDQFQYEEDKYNAEQEARRGYETVPGVDTGKPPGGEPEVNADGKPVTGKPRDFDEVYDVHVSKFKGRWSQQKLEELDDAGHSSDPQAIKNVALIKGDNTLDPKYQPERNIALRIQYRQWQIRNGITIIEPGQHDDAIKSFLDTMFTEEKVLDKQGRATDKEKDSPAKKAAKAILLTEKGNPYYDEVPELQDVRDIVDRQRLEQDPVYIDRRKAYEIEHKPPALEGDQTKIPERGTMGWLWDTVVVSGGGGGIDGIVSIADLANSVIKAGTGVELVSDDEMSAAHEVVRNAQGAMYTDRGKLSAEMIDKVLTDVKFQPAIECLANNFDIACAQEALKEVDLKQFGNLSAGDAVQMLAGVFGSMWAGGGVGKAVGSAVLRKGAKAVATGKKVETVAETAARTARAARIGMGTSTGLIAGSWTAAQLTDMRHAIDTMPDEAFLSSPQGLESTAELKADGFASPTPDQVREHAKSHVASIDTWNGIKMMAYNTLGFVAGPSGQVLRKGVTGSFMRAPTVVKKGLGRLGNMVVEGAGGGVSAAGVGETTNDMRRAVGLPDQDYSGSVLISAGLGAAGGLAAGGRGKAEPKPGDVPTASLEERTLAAARTAGKASDTADAALKVAKEELDTAAAAAKDPTLTPDAQKAATKAFTDAQKVYNDAKQASKEAAFKVANLGAAYNKYVQSLDLTDNDAMHASTGQNLEDMLDEMTADTFASQAAATAANQAGAVPLAVDYGLAAPKPTSVEVPPDVLSQMTRVQEAQAAVDAARGAKPEVLKARQAALAEAQATLDAMTTTGKTTPEAAPLAGAGVVDQLATTRIDLEQAEADVREATATLSQAKAALAEAAGAATTKRGAAKYAKAQTAYTKAKDAYDEQVSARDNLRTTFDQQQGEVAGAETPVDYGNVPLSPLQTRIAELRQQADEALAESDVIDWQHFVDRQADEYEQIQAELQLDDATNPVRFEDLGVIDTDNLPPNYDGGWGTTHSQASKEAVPVPPSYRALALWTDPGAANDGLSYIAALRAAAEVEARETGDVAMSRAAFAAERRQRYQEWWSRSLDITERARANDLAAPVSPAPRLVGPEGPAGLLEYAANPSYEELINLIRRTSQERGIPFAELLEAVRRNPPPELVGEFTERLALPAPPAATDFVAGPGGDVLADTGVYPRSPRLMPALPEGAPLRGGARPLTEPAVSAELAAVNTFLDTQGSDLLRLPPPTGERTGVFGEVDYGQGRERRRTAPFERPRPGMDYGLLRKPTARKPGDPLSHPTGETPPVAEPPPVVADTAAQKIGRVKSKAVKAPPNVVVAQVVKVAPTRRKEARVIATPQDALPASSLTTPQLIEALAKVHPDGVLKLREIARRMVIAAKSGLKYVEESYAGKTKAEKESKAAAIERATAALEAATKAQRAVNKLDNVGVLTKARADAIRILLENNELAQATPAAAPVMPRKAGTLTSTRKVEVPVAPKADVLAAPEAAPAAKPAMSAADTLASKEALDAYAAENGVSVEDARAFLTKYAALEATPKAESVMKEAPILEETLTKAKARNKKLPKADLISDAERDKLNAIKTAQTAYDKAATAYAAAQRAVKQVKSIITEQDVVNFRKKMDDAELALNKAKGIDTKIEVEARTGRVLATDEVIARLKAEREGAPPRVAKTKVGEKVPEVPKDQQPSAGEVAAVVDVQTGKADC